jgi:hypothetical protein
MYIATVTRQALLGVLVALALFIGALLITSPKASAAKSECSAGTVCAWQNSNFTGKFSQWSAAGCYNHSENPQIRSGWNRTSVNARFGGAGILESGKAFELLSGNPITGEICFPV